MDLLLYSYFRSSSAYRVRIALNLKGLDYSIKPVHLLKDGGEQFKEPLKRLNPSQKVPVLQHGDKTIAHSVAIIEYLDEVFPDKNLYPREAFHRALVRQLCEIVNSEIQPLQNLSVLKTLMGEYGFSEDQKIQWIRHWISTGFSAFETLLTQTTSGEFCFGDQPTAADCFLIPQVYNAERFEVDMTSFPLISKVSEFCRGLEAFEKAHPSRQPDTPSE